MELLVPPQPKTCTINYLVLSICLTLLYQFLPSGRVFWPRWFLPPTCEEIAVHLPPTMLANDLNHSSIKVYLQGISSFFCPAVTSFSLFTLTLPLTNPLSSCASSLDHWPSIYDISFIHNDGCYATTVKFVWRSNKRFQIVVLKNCKLVEFNCYLYTLRNIS